MTETYYAEYAYDPDSCRVVHVGNAHPVDKVRLSGWESEGVRDCVSFDAETFGSAKSFVDGLRKKLVDTPVYNAGRPWSRHCPHVGRAGTVVDLNERIL